MKELICFIYYFILRVLLKIIQNGVLNVLQKLDFLFVSLVSRHNQALFLLRFKLQLSQHIQNIMLYKQLPLIFRFSQFLQLFFHHHTLSLIILDSTLFLSYLVSNLFNSFCILCLSELYTSDISLILCPLCLLLNAPQSGQNAYTQSSQKYLIFR